ncbi:hypothetical protein [Streptomyces sp. ME19-01-6]|uniref:hypothetical protein n=1 Tax=Streptomyces sp. ME19-01-6 TaxID=3028686 RepID=UPI0029B81288|nr:hypothetical protein [Streptomyces sp. ME19-01-6]MDX3226278.1 hypothetical protein [Streptomyces sp. ME19-01-6]
MTTHRRTGLAIAAVMCGAAVAAGPAAEAIAAPAPTSVSSAVTQTGGVWQGGSDSAKGAVSTQAARAHRIWGPAWISPEKLKSNGKKWVSRNYTSKGKWTGVAVRCYNNRAKMRVRILNVDAGRYIADKKAQCDRNVSIVAWSNKFQRRDTLRVVLLGDQGSYVKAYYKNR